MLLGISLTLFMASTSAAAAYEHDPHVIWTMVDVTSGDAQGDAHLIEAGRHTMLIDTGNGDLARSRLVPFLEQRAIHSIDILFLTHLHEDHYGGVEALLEAGVDISEIQISIPDREVCRREIPWGCDETKIAGLLSRIEAHGVDVHEPDPGETWGLGDGASLELIARLDGDTPDAPSIDVNDTSMIMRLDVGDTTVLFTGDLNKALGRVLTRRDLRLGSNVLLKVPHHGAESVAENEFFAHVDPDTAFVPAPTALWCSDRASRVRVWLDEHDVPAFVSGAHGHVTVSIDRDGETIEAERGQKPC